MSKVITTLVDIDQTGFIPAKSTDTNLRRLFAHLQIAHPNSGAIVVVSFDMEKAFDSVDWTYMTSVFKVYRVWFPIHGLDLIVVQMP